MRRWTLGSRYGEGGTLGSRYGEGGTLGSSDWGEGGTLGSGDWWEGKCFPPILSLQSHPSPDPWWSTLIVKYSPLPSCFSSSAAFTCRCVRYQGQLKALKKLNVFLKTCMISNYPNNKNWSNKGKTENQFIQNCEEIYIVKPGSWKISKKNSWKTRFSKI